MTEDRGVQILEHPPAATRPRHGFGHLSCETTVVGRTGRTYTVVVSCTCDRWSRRTGPYCTPLLARRVAYGLVRRHARDAARGLVTVTGGHDEPEQVEALEDERAFLHETAGYVGRGRPHVLPALLPEDEERQQPWMPAASPVELHPATEADLERYGELVPA